MLYEVEGDLVAEDKYNIFCHQTNCHGVMGSGIARQIAVRYPAVAARDKDYCRLHNPLGTMLPVRVQPNRVCVNLYGQYNYGRGQRFTDYRALQTALYALASRLNKSNIPEDWVIGFPYRMGCGLAGGGWNHVRPMIEDFAKRVMQDVYIVHLSERENV